MKKTIPFMFTILAIASIASTAVLGNPQTAYAGNGCVLEPDMVDAGILDIGDRFVVLKKVTCSEDILTVDLFDIDCVDKGIEVRLGDFGINGGVWDGEEVIDNIPGASGKITCTVDFKIEFTGGFTGLFQTIMVTTPAPTVVGGEFSPIDSTALLLASTQSFSWMIPVLLSGIGIGLFVVTRKNE